MAYLKSLSSGNLYGESSRDAMLALFANSEFLTFMEANSGWELDATDFDFQTITDVADLRTMAEGGTYGELKTLAQDSKLNKSLKFYYDGFKVPTTRKLDADLKLRNIDIWLQKKRAAYHRSNALLLEKAIWTHDGTSNRMNGFAKQLNGTTRLQGYTDTTKYSDEDGLRVVNAESFTTSSSDTSLDISLAASTANLDAFVEAMYTMLTKMKGCKGVAISELLKPRLTTIARKTDMYGSTQIYEQQFDTIMGLPIISLPSDVITITEPDGAGTPNNDTTSMYFLNPGEQKCSIVTNSGFWYYEYDHDKNEQKDTELFGINMELKIEDNKSVMRLNHLKV